MQAVTLGSMKGNNAINVLLQTEHLRGRKKTVLQHDVRTRTRRDPESLQSVLMQPTV